MKLYVVHPIVKGRGFCKCKEMKGGYSPLLLQPSPNALSGAGMRNPDMTKVKSVLSGLQPTKPYKKYISL